MGVTVDVFILNITTTFNSSTAHEPDGTASGSVQNQWFIQQTNNSNADFKIVLVHNEPYGSFQDDPNVQSWNLEQYVDIVMSGDVQAYERNSITTEYGNAIFLSVGVAGLKLENEVQTLAETSEIIIYEYGALFMEIKENGLFFQFQNKDGEVRDTFSVTK